MTFTTTRRAFTLIELMVTIAIIGILTALATTSYVGVRARARDAQRKNDLTQLKINLNTYYIAQTPVKYPLAEVAKVTLNNTNDVLFTALVPAYAKSIPLDPLNSGNNVYKYQSSGNGSSYTLYGTLENTNDKKGWGTSNAWVVDGLQLTPD